MTRGEANDLVALRWRFVHRRLRSPFFSYCFFGGCAQLLNPTGLDYRLWHMGVFEDRVAVDQERWNALEQRIIAQMDAQPAWFRRSMRTCALQRRAAQRRWKGLLREDWSKASTFALRKALKSYVEDLLGFDAYVSWPPIMEAELERRLRAGLDEQDFAVATDPVAGGSILQEREALLRLAGLRGPRREKALTAHALRFGWMKNVGYLGELYDVAHYREQAELASKKNAGKLLSQLHQQERARAKRFAALLRSLAGRPDVAAWVKTANEAVAFRSFRTELFYESYRFVRGLLSACEQRLELGERDALYLFPDELLGALSPESGADSKLIAARRVAYVYVSLPKGMYLTAAGAEARRLGSRILPPNLAEKAAEVRGQPAFAGRVSGRAVLVRALVDLRKVGKGDVLVTHATNIDYVPALRRAAAVVTEEGGILCHAAVVSRELRIPAVVGTGNATALFQDGDRLDVDARAGWVRRL